MAEPVEDLKKRVTDFQKEKIKFLLAANKTDQGDEAEIKEKYAAVDGIIFISAKENRHIEVVKEKMIDIVLAGQVQTENIIVTNTRHLHALKEVAKSLNDIKEGLDEKLPGDLLAPDIRRCLHYLGEITGEITNEDQLEYIFSKFCIGK
jgi:tRNA modification GTPase